VNSLAGYARTSSDDVFAFAVIVNNETQKPDSTQLIDSIVSAFAK
jgi:D-alanyl-D-alanine carboxypeptidase